MVRGAAAQTLATLGAPDSAPDILQAIQGEMEKWPRIYLAGAVQRLRILKASEIIISWLGDADEDVRRTAEGTLVLLSGQKYGSDQAKWRAWYETVQK
jgi:HEAT repeat protein